MDKTNCFANIGDSGCFALKKKDCENCNFYKPSNNGEAARARIERACYEYNKTHN